MRQLVHVLCVDDGAAPLQRASSEARGDALGVSAAIELRGHKAAPQ